MNTSGQGIVSLSLFFAVALIFLVSAAAVTATETIRPGESITLTPDACATASGYRLLNQDVWDACLGCLAVCDQGTQTAHGYLDLIGTAGYKYVTSTIYGQFTIADSADSRTRVTTTINYDIAWKGFWQITGFFTGYNDAKSEVIVYLYDVTNGSRVVKKTDPPVHSQTPDGFAAIDVVEGGVGYDEGGTQNSMTATLIRGHTYRVALTLHMNAKGALNASLTMDYTGNRGLTWNDFQITVEPDLNERINELEERVEALENEVDHLRSNLEHHTHTYLTGRGAGHNNTEAQTSAAIIMDDHNIPDSVLTWIGDDESSDAPLPKKSAVLTNYPNPFNPETTILFSLPKGAPTRIVVYNSLGQEVETLLDEYCPPGEHEVEFNAQSLATGVYFYRLTTPQYSETRKLLLLR